MARSLNFHPGAYQLEIMYVAHLGIAIRTYVASYDLNTYVDMYVRMHALTM